METKKYNIIKRCFDICISIIAIIFLIPIYIIVAPVIKLETKGKVIYKQKRIGKKGKIIEIYKFRTMVSNADSMIQELTKEQIRQYKEEYKIEQDPRITKIGEILRKTNIDELPQIINVIKGEMSIIGVRPIIEEELEKYNQEEREIFLSVIPGISGYWQVNREKCDNYEERKKLELYYAKNKNLKLDFKILIKTIKVLIGLNNSKNCYYEQINKEEELQDDTEIFKR